MNTGGFFSVSRTLVTTGTSVRLFVCLFVSYLAGRLVPPIGDPVHELVGVDVPHVQLAAVFEERRERVLHVQRGLPLVLAHLQLEVGLADVSCEGGGQERLSGCLEYE